MHLYLPTSTDFGLTALAFKHVCAGCGIIATIGCGQTASCECRASRSVHSENYELIFTLITGYRPQIPIPPPWTCTPHAMQSTAIDSLLELAIPGERLCSRLCTTRICCVANSLHVVIPFHDSEPDSPFGLTQQGPVCLSPTQQLSHSHLHQPGIVCVSRWL